MSERIVNQTVIVVRDGKRVVPPIGRPFDFTAAELKDIEAVAPEAVRKLINETAKDDDGEQDNTPKTTAKGKSTKASGKEAGKEAGGEGGDGL